MFKAHHAATQELLERDVSSSRWFWIAIILFELALGLWLISGFHERVARWIAVATFLAFFEVSLYLALIDAPSCACFGRLSIRPWQAMFFDLLSFGMLLVWQPAGTMTVMSHPRWFLTMAGAYALVGILVLISVLNYAPLGPMIALRNDPQLAKTISLHTKNITLHELLAKLHTVTGLRLTISDNLGSHVDEQQLLGEVQTDRAQAWALLEWLAVKQTMPARWETTSDGYKLISAAPLGLTFPWVVSGLIFLSATLGAVILRK
jgi:hypothetical protein